LAFVGTKRKLVSRKCAKARRNFVPAIEELAATVIDRCFPIHEELGPGLLESIYEAVPAQALRQHGLSVDQQQSVPVALRGMGSADALRADLVIRNSLVIAVMGQNAAVRPKQLFTCSRLMKQHLGSLMNFGRETFRDGVKRVVNGHISFARSRLCMKQ